jgi:hypothetical protein
MLRGFIWPRSLLEGTSDGSFWVRRIPACALLLVGGHTGFDQKGATGRHDR